MHYAHKRHQSQPCDSHHAKYSTSLLSKFYPRQQQCVCMATEMKCKLNLILIPLRRQSPSPLRQECGHVVCWGDEHGRQGQDHALSVVYAQAGDVQGALHLPLRAPEVPPMCLNCQAQTCRQLMHRVDQARQFMACLYGTDLSSTGWLEGRQSHLNKMIWWFMWRCSHLASIACSYRAWPDP